MSTDHRAALSNIRRFDQLIPYLRDEMGWPISEDSFERVDDLFYDFTPDELGIDPQTAAKIQEIKRLRPLSPRQPWGIFFVKFEPKRLPVVALRRILNHVALKKRASANSAERSAWARDDLLFISNYGESHERRISFAHFSPSENNKDLPTLKVLGWDNLDSALHLDGVAEKLTRNLAWPQNEDDVDGWRTRWRSAFTLRHREVITTSRELSVRLAELSRAIRDRIRSALAIETELGPLTRLYKAFQVSLVHDLDSDGFADMYAQTIAYGLLSARIADPTSRSAADFATHLRTNPFLRELMTTFLRGGESRSHTGAATIDFDELGVSEIVQLLDAANIEAVVRDFGDQNPEEDPVIHFYELFLKEYDAKKRMQRGVFYTARPVVSFIVRSIDELLRTKFGLSDGLADTVTWGEMAKRHRNLVIPDGIPTTQAFVQVLDPAVGTGTFLVETIELVHHTMAMKWKEEGHTEQRIGALWNDYVPEHLLPRIYGYELLMAPYAIAHLKVGLKLLETGYQFKSEERVRIYLTNALEPASDLGQQSLARMFSALAREARAVNSVKRDQHFTVLLGNPPYSGTSANNGEWISRLIQDYYEVDGKRMGERNPKWLQDDYVKFLRFGQDSSEKNPFAILGLITNHGYIDNPTFRGLRQSLIRTFPQAWILDLHGNAKKRETGPDGKADENVFDIQQGVSILMAMRGPSASPGVRKADLFGTREIKYEFLRGNSVGMVEWTEIRPVSPFYVFVRQDEAIRAEYLRYPSIKTVMEVNVLGFQTHRDHFAIDFDRETVISRFEAMRDARRSDAEIRATFDLKDNRDWKLSEARSTIRADPRWKSHIIRCLFRPFDVRWCYFSPVAVEYPRRELLEHVAGRENLCLLLPRQIGFLPWRHAGISDTVAESCAISAKTKEQNYNFPLYLFDNGEVKSRDGQTRPNLSMDFLIELGQSLESSERGPNGLPNGTTPEHVLCYAYAVFHSPTYRARYGEFLKMDFPRLPYPGSSALFRGLASLGRHLIDLHLSRLLVSDERAALYFGQSTPKVGNISYHAGTVWLDDSQESGFRTVPESVWNFHIGGHQVCDKWLKDRRGRTLSIDDIAQYEQIVDALAETMRLMLGIENIIEEHGGWPTAFHGREVPNELAQSGPSFGGQMSFGKDGKIRGTASLKNWKS
jgi:hypothetical protein